MMDGVFLPFNFATTPCRLRRRLTYTNAFVVTPKWHISTMIDVQY
jgi:hypothetical protein